MVIENNKTKKMKKACVLFLSIVSILLTGGCDKIDELTQFEMEFNETVVIPSSTGIDLPFNIFTPDIESNSESTFSSNNTRKDLIEEILLTEMELTLSSPDSGDLGFLKSIEIYISAEGVSEEKIAWNENIPNDVGKVISLETSSVDLKEFIKKDQFKLELKTTTDEIITSDHQIEVRSLFFVDAEILGL